MPRTEVNRNLLFSTNPSFETAPTFVAATNVVTRWIDGTAAGSTATTSAFKWGTVSGTNAGTFSAQFDDSQKYSGSYSLKVSTGAVSSAIDVSPVVNITTANVLRSGIPVSGSTSYTCTYWMKTAVTSGTANDGACINFNERNTAAGGSVNNKGTLVKTTTDWTLYTVTFTTASATRFLVPRLSVVGTTGTATLIMDAWFDDIVIKPTIPVTRTAVS